MLLRHRRSYIEQDRIAHYYEVQKDWSPCAECDMFVVRAVLGLSTTPPTTKMVVALVFFQHSAQARPAKNSELPSVYHLVHETFSLCTLSCRVLRLFVPLPAIHTAVCQSEGSA